MAIARQLHPPAGGNAVLLFGCQWLSFDADDFRQLRTTVLDNPEYHWMLDVLAELPRYYRLASTEHLPSLQCISGEQKLRDLERWFRCDDLSTAKFPLAYIQLAPLLMMTHFTQYGQYLRFTHPQYVEDGTITTDESPVVEIVGFCIGFLSAAVASAADTRDQLQALEAVAMRLSMLLGAIGDMKEFEEGYTSLATMWKTPELEGRLPELLHAHPGSYITVRYDENRVTVMTRRQSVASLQHALQSAGFSANRVDFNGRYHWPGHQDTLPALFSLCDAHCELQLPDAKSLVRPLRENTTGEPVRCGPPLHQLVLRAVLAQPCVWLKTFSSVHQAYLTNPESIVIEFGPERCVPPTFLPQLPQGVVHFADLDLSQTLSRDHELSGRPPAETDIAVVGMACRVAGADDLNEFWQLLCKGESQHREMPRERHADYETPWRPDASKKPWFGNFVRDIDAFDHKFFKKVPREVISQDPQQRLILQVAYQALEQGGYFTHPLPTSKNIGCYIASCTVDYEHNVNCYPASAYAATGLLRSFLAGKLSHYFGWRGPSLCIDTACSGSAVALHHACRAIMNGDCTAALVGGANAITSPLAYDNLAGASFLSPTGACKPFDANADGYCRGEGFAAIYIKKLSDAIADGDPVLATIAGTAVEQNDNCTPIVVPDAPSLAGLFEKVTRCARLYPRDITVVEAHGTGTQAGDPAEYRGVREVLGGPRRPGKLALGSVKGLVGHTEGVSGMIALCKVVLMIQEGQIPPQPGFHSLNQHIKVSPDDHIDIATTLKSWDSGFRAALINNYGACGSNASIVLTQGPKSIVEVTGGVHDNDVPLPFRFCASEKARLQAYAVKFREFLAHQTETKGVSLANLAFHVARQSNPSLNCQGVFCAKSLTQLDSTLAALGDGDEKPLVRVQKTVRPVILCFGGQVGRCVGIDRSLYDAFPLFRSHLDACDSLLTAMGEKSIYPGIFSATPVSDTVQLQTQLFSLQYACARSWIDSGLNVTAVVGHSFGELTALCISGVLSLPDALTVILRRAVLIRDSWGQDPGAMLAVEGDKAGLKQHMEGSGASIACFNGPRSFTIAGPTRAVDTLQETLESDPNVRVKRLSITNAFHCSLVDTILPALYQVTDGLKLNTPRITLERATAMAENGIPPSTVIGDHLRQPVHFEDAVRRLATQHGPSVWLEAGSNSTIASMVRRALDSSGSEHAFHSLNMSTGSSLQSLTDATIGLWKDRISCMFWAHHPLQSREYTPLVLPPYQFEKSRHWLENKPLPITASSMNDKSESPEDEPRFSFVGYQDSLQRRAKFLIHTNHPWYIESVSGHCAAKTAPIAPASLLLDYAVEALRSLPDNKGRIPSMHDVGSEAPLCLNPNREVWLELTAEPDSKYTWSLKFQSQDRQPGPGCSLLLLHCTGRVTMHDPSDGKLKAEFTRYSRLVSHSRCKELLSDPDVDDILQGQNVYRTFSEIVEYSQPYRGVQKLVGKGNESAGRVIKRYSGQTWADAFLCDSFSQIGGFWVNCMTDRPDDEIYIASGIEQWMRSPRYANLDTPRPDTWEVFAKHQRADGWYTSDVFVFGADGDLAEVFLGLRYSRVAKNLFIRLLGGSVPKREEGPKEEKRPQENSSSADLVERVKAVVAEFCALDPDEIQNDSHLANAGVDSLMAMELARELEEAFHRTLSVEELLEAETFADLVRCVQAAVGVVVPENGSLYSIDSATVISSTSSDRKPSSPTESLTSVSDTADLSLPFEVSVEAFRGTKAFTDRFLEENQCSGRLHEFTPLQVKLCVVLTLEAFETLGSNIRSAQVGERLRRIPFDSQHQSLVDYLYNRLEEACLISLDGMTAVRSEISAPTESSTSILSQIESEYPEYAGASKLAFYTGSQLASVLRGEQDGLHLIFGTPEGQQLVSWMYGEEPHNVAGYKLMAEYIRRVVEKVVSSAAGGCGPLKILEMGAGTGGGTKWFLPLLAALPVPVEYTFSDISPAFLAQARRKFKDYPFIRYCVHDIEKPPAAELQRTQHIIIASNAVHATSNLQESTRNMRQALRADGVLMMLEMTQPVFAIDLVFGLFRGWWVFNDGRTHAITSEKRWEEDLHAAGYGHVDWSDGESKEVSIQRVIFATAQGEQGERLPSPVLKHIERMQVVEKYAQKAIQGFTAPGMSLHEHSTESDKTCVLVTGASGSLGSHVVAHLATLSTVDTVVCLNRISGEDPLRRQQKSFAEKGLSLSAAEEAKLVVLEVNSQCTELGLAPDQYKFLQTSVTHIIHNAWPMNGVMPLSSFEPQFRVLRNLLDLARDAAEMRARPLRFVFVSSIGTVGGGGALEKRTQIEQVMANGYNEAKFVCERMVQETLQRYPERFQATVTRPGQIAGSAQTGYWNTPEHFPAMVKSSQTLGVFPTLQGEMGWTPVDVAAHVLSELLLAESDPEEIYHIDNPVGQNWSTVVGIIAEELNATTVPFKEWIQRVRQEESNRGENPARVMANWLDQNFELMSCRGGLDTRVARKHSRTLREMERVGEETVRKFIANWRERKFLS
ncbi:hypothetical protein P175DRAFT_0492673 [Aspergillus ochraceoroseus IBT 24754]|uniref:Uncharacterized protein n=1 Tax=Aspergillus ochraceoroseus IBT 24754 TaxID=1392256 RepID=A0A2T5M0L5_9EURO|nr:uncharacterized protein P175DRAFT_0492673 [Aspergillus ochraceoroseus IBT 24754]PTU22070.1 hypothetical protein P175DRAFT_0492673 [Aspergillus ochraceoroseus IBT 24754]